MKTYFTNPSVEVIKFAVEDVITVSGEEEEEFDPLEPPCL
jgi:hypothetical protein